MADLPLSSDPWPELSSNPSQPNVITMYHDEGGAVDDLNAALEAHYTQRAPGSTWTVMSRSVVDGTQIAIWRS